MPMRMSPSLRRTRRPAGYLIDVRALEKFAQMDVAGMERVTKRYAFRASEYYAGLVDWSAEDDPIRRLIVPCESELTDFGRLDVSDEAANTQMRGLQHKYPDTALLLVTDQCAGLCRYCFRKRLFQPGSREASRDIAPSVRYIREHAEITDVLLTGGDPLTLPTPQLADILRSLRDIEHVRTVRIGTKVVAFNPYRILDDRRLQAVLRSHVAAGKALYVMCHFDHPRELTAEAVRAVRLLRKLGATCVNQCPISRGINDDAGVLAELLQRCTEAGCPQYYLFQSRPTAGNGGFVVPIVRGFELLSEARSTLSGLSRRARFCMSHSTGKIEIAGVDDRAIYARYHRAKNPADQDRMIVLRRDDSAYWLDQLEPIAGSTPPFAECA